MEELSLDHDFTLGAEVYKKVLRLIVYQRNNVFVCRKTTFTEMNKFLNEKEASLFKGRLQLFKNQDYISIKAKKDIVGKTSSQSLQSFLNAQLTNS